MNPKTQCELAALVLPGHGFFGAHDCFRLSIRIDDVVDKIDIGLSSEEDTYLNLAGVELFDTGGSRIALSDVCSACTLSTSMELSESWDALPVLIKGGAIHSGLERAPLLSLVLDSPLAIGHIQIANRPGLYGQRMRRLTLRAEFEHKIVTQYVNCDEVGLLNMFNSLVSRIDRPVNDTISTQNEIGIESVALIQTISSSLKSGHLVCTLPELMALLPMYEREPIVNDSVLTAIGEILSLVISEKQEIPTTALKDFQHILDSPKRITRAAAYADSSLNRHSTVPSTLIVGKHKIGYSDLLGSKEAYKAAMLCVQQQMQEWAMLSMVCYGTLLGAVRDQGFIPHDDDVDMLYFDDSSSQEEMMNNRLVVMGRFRDANYRIWDSGVNFQVCPPGFNVGVDLFPCWTNGEKTCLMMERYRYREIPTAVLMPESKITLYGNSYPAPNDCAAFLAQRYGDSWTQSDPFHEWPWPLVEPGKWQRRSKQRKLQANRTLLIAWGQHVGPGHVSPPKNSPSLIEKALQQGYDAVELDVRLSQDGQFVLGHDDCIVGKNGNRVVISESSLAELAQFELDDYEETRNTIISLKHALEMIGDRIAHLDVRISPDQIVLLREFIDSIEFDPAKIIFCGYGDEYVRNLNVSFPESVVLYKYYGSYAHIDDFVLEELVDKQVDGLMLYWPMHYEDCEVFTNRLQHYNLQVLFYVHGSWPARGEKDLSEVSLRKMATARVNYVTSTASNSDSFKQLVSSRY